MIEVNMRALRAEATEHHLVIQGGHFQYTIQRSNGLINDIQVKGESWLSGFAPDLWASVDVDPRTQAYFAQFAKDASLTWREGRAGGIVAEATGQMARIDGQTLPLIYRLLYEFHVDGTVKVQVTYEATHDLVLRWLTRCQVSIPSSRCRFISRETDMAQSTATCRPVSRALDVADEGEKADAGRFIPWWHFGNDHTGVEFVFLSSDNTQSGWTDTSPYPTGDPLGRSGDLFVCEQKRAGLTLTAYLIRNLREHFTPGMQWHDAFYISVVPGRPHDPRADDMRVAWIGPHQYRNGWAPPGESTIQNWVRQGVNWVIGGVNWFSGNYSRPATPEATERFLAQCHAHGLKVMPYITFTDMEYGAEGFGTHDRDWRIEPVAEFNYRSHLMCYGAEGWQARWQAEVDGIFDRFAFDGLYIDFWAGRLACRNTRHGCVGPYGRFTAEGLRNMARYAYEKVQASTTDGLILANTNILPLAMINNWFHARLYGEWHNLEETDPLSLRIFYNSRRLGTGSVLLVRNVPHITRRTVALAEMFLGVPVITHARTEAERACLRELAHLKADFDVAHAVGWNHFQLQPIWREAGPDVLPQSLRMSLFYHPKRTEVLLALSAASSEAIEVSLSSLLDAIEKWVLKPAGYALPTGRACMVWEENRLIEPVGDSSPLTLNDEIRHVWVKERWQS